MPQKEQLASMNHLLAQTVLESALQEHAYATQSAAMAFQISEKPARAVLRMFSARAERSAARMEAAKFRAEGDNAAMARWMTARNAILAMATDSSSSATAAITTVTMIARCPSAATESGMPDASAEDEAKHATMETS